MDIHYALIDHKYTHPTWTYTSCEYNVENPPNLFGSFSANRFTKTLPNENLLHRILLKEHNVNVHFLRLRLKLGFSDAVTVIV